MLVINYEGVDKDEDIDPYFRNLSIDIRNNYTSESELFYPKFEQFHTSID